MDKKKKERVFEESFYFSLFFMLSISVFCTLLFPSTNVSASDSVIDIINIDVPTSCSLSGTGQTSHNEDIINGTYMNNIGTTTLKAFCNDHNGFAIYATGYTNNTIGEENSNKLIGTTSSGNATIVTGTNTGPVGGNDISNFAMKLTVTGDSGDTTGTNATIIDSAPNIEGGESVSFTNYHTVPNTYVKVAHKNSHTDMNQTTGGATLTTTYAAYISKTQPADMYTGQVKYTLVHPSNHDAPIANPAVLDTGRVVNSKLKSLAATVVNGEETTITPEFDPDDGYDWENAYDRCIKSISVHLKTPAPADFSPSEMNTISSTASKKPIYIVFDNTNDAGIMHFYTEGEKIFLPSDSSFMFYLFDNLSEISGISDWNTSNVTNMSYMFYNAGHSATTFTLDLSSWNTSNVASMSGMFYSAGYSATTFTLDLSSWNTSNVTSMSYMFHNAGYSATAFTLNLSSWNTSNVTSMSYMFYNAGHSATTWSIGNLSSWNTSNVEDMSRMFSGAGYSATTFTLDLSSWNTSNVASMSGMFSNAGRSATTWSVTIPQTNGNSINNTTSRLYGQTTSKYAAPPSGKSFTIAQP